MKTKSFIVAIAISAITIISACKKTPATDPGITQAGNVQTIYDQTQTPAQTFSVNVSNYNTIAGTKGTVINVPAGSLLHQNGSTVTGSVQFQLKELYSHGDMILNNAATESNGSLLQSGGEIYLTATQGSESLHINHANPLFVKFPTSNATAGMQLFTGNFTGATSNTPGTINWNPVTNANATIVLDTATFNSYFGFATDSFGWTNCDRFNNLTGGTDPQVQLPTGFDNTNTRVLMLFDAENSLATADLWASPTYKFHSGSHTPIGIHVTIIALAVKGTQLYYCIQHQTTSAGAVFNMSMTAADIATIKAAVSAL